MQSLDLNLNIDITVHPDNHLRGQSHEQPNVNVYLSRNFHKTTEPYRAGYSDAIINRVTNKRKVLNHWEEFLRELLNGNQSRVNSQEEDSLSFDNQGWGLSVVYVNVKFGGVNFWQVV
uniref:Uncharacterized protein n=1 Tax=Megaselia scalaris TaxID=36166 RepID=T1GUJ4_MEGSC